MIPDRPLLDALAREIDSALRGCRVRRVHQPEPWTLVLRLRGPSGERRLLACADPAEARVHLTRADRPNPRTPFPFCMLARKHLEGRAFEGAAAEPVIPVITLRFGPRPAAGNATPAPDRVRLVVEWTGHASTVALLAEREGAPRILGLLRPLPRAQRVLAPGAIWTPPARPGRLDASTASPGDLVSTLARIASRGARRSRAKREPTEIHRGSRAKREPTEIHRGSRAKREPTEIHRESRAKREPTEIRREGADRLISRAFEGVGRRLAGKALRLAGIDPWGPSPALDPVQAERCLASLREILAAPCAPHVVIDAEGAPAELLTGPFPGLPTRPVDSISEALEAIHARRGGAARLSSRRAEVIRMIQRQREHRETKLGRQRGELEEARRSDRQRVLADLLLAQGSPQRRGETSIEVTDLHDASLPRVTIPLDPSLSLAGNAERLYQRARKSARAVGVLSRIIARGAEEIALLEKALAGVQTATEIAAIEGIADGVRRTIEARTPRVPAERARAASGGIAPAGRAPEPPEGPRRFLVDGWEILAGRHSRDNDRIVTAWGRPDDLWFHARDVPGAHVLLRNPARIEPPAAVLEAAARIAAHYSPRRDDAGVDVIVAAMRHVRKRRGLPAGRVEVSQGRTLRVRAGLPGPEQDAPGSPGVA